MDGLGEYSDDADREDEGEGGVVGKGGGGGQMDGDHPFGAQTACDDEPQHVRLL